MNKSQAIEIAKTITPSNIQDVILKMEEEYFSVTNGSDRYRAEILSNINPFVISQLSEEQSDLLNGMKQSSKKGANEEALTLALRKQMHEIFHDKMFYSMKNATKVFFFVHAGNTLERYTADEKKVEKALLTMYIEDSAGHPKVVVDGEAVTVPDGEAISAINHMLNRVAPLPPTGSPVWSHDESVVAFGHPLVQPEDGKFPVIREWFDALTDGEAFAAWIYAVAYTGYKGRDVPWIYSPNKVRKSLILNGIFSALFGTAFQTISAPDVKTKNQFFTSQFENSRMAGILDCKNPKMIMDSFTHQLTGRDPVRVEHKGEKIYSSVLDAALFITSNCRPEIDQDGSSVSRLFPITFKSRIGGGEILEVEGGGSYFGETYNIAELIKDEVPAFLYWAEECYSNLVDGIGYSFKFNETTMRLKSEAIARVEHRSIMIFKNHLVLDNDGYVTYTDIELFCKQYGGQKQFFVSNFVEWIRKKYGLCVVDFEYGEGVINGLRLKEDGEDFESFRGKSNASIF